MATLGRSPPLRHATRATSPASTGEHTRRLEYAAYASHSAFCCGVNVPDETGKMSRSDKRGATLPKVVTVVSLPYSAINADAFETIVL